jgi:hypothetical protein
MTYAAHWACALGRVARHSSIARVRSRSGSSSGTASPTGRARIAAPLMLPSSSGSSPVAWKCSGHPPAMRPQAVNILGLTVHVIHKTKPVKGNVYRISGCGGGVPARLFGIDLDRPVPLVRAQASQGIDPATGQATKLSPVAFPYRISDTDPEDFLITAQTGRYDCTWQLRLEWSSNGSNHIATLPGNGDVFRTTASTGLPRYVLVQGPGGGWQKDHGQ